VLTDPIGPTGVSKTAGLLAGAKSIGEAGAFKYYKARVGAAYRQAIADAKLRGLPDVKAGNYGDVVTKRWASTNLPDFDADFSLRRNYPGSSRGAQPDVILPKNRAGLELKKSPGAFRSSQHQAILDLFQDFRIEYVYGNGCPGPCLGASVWSRAYQESVVGTAVSRRADGDQ